MQRSNSRYRRMLRRLPAELAEILAGLSADYRVLHGVSQYMGWSGEIQIGSRRFTLISEGGRVCLSERSMPSSTWPGVGSPGSLLPKEVAGVLNRMVERRRECAEVLTRVPFEDERRRGLRSWFTR